MLKKLTIISLLILILLSSYPVCSSKILDVQVVCSSYLNNSPHYSIVNVLDSNIRTCWAEGVSTDGSGLMKDKIYGHCDTWTILPNERNAEMVTFYFPLPPNDIIVTRMRIYNGYGKSKAVWKENNRVKLIGIRYGRKAVIQLKDCGWNDIDLRGFMTKSCKFTGSISLYILKTYRGSKYNDTCISEIEFYNQSYKYHIDKITVISPSYDTPDDEEG